MQDQDQERIRIKRDRGNQNVELLRSEEEPSPQESRGRRLGGCYRLLRCGLGWGRLLRLSGDVRPADRDN